VKKYEGTILVVDAISALVAHDLKMDQWGIDVLIAGSQKGLMLPPGLAFVELARRHGSVLTRHSVRNLF